METYMLGMTKAERKKYVSQRQMVGPYLPTDLVSRQTSQIGKRKKVGVGQFNATPLRAIREHRTLNWSNVRLFE
jgi:hypothetical protein